jgi:adenylate cyclase
MFSFGRSSSTPRPAPALPGAGMRGAWQRLGERLRSFRTPRLGEVLVRERVVTRPQLVRALERQSQLELPLGRTVVELGLAQEGEVLAAINKHYRIAASALTEHIAAMIRSRADSRRSLSRLRRLLRVRLSLVLVAVIWATILALSLVLLGRQQAQLTQGAVRLGALGVSFLAESAKVPLLQGDPLQLSRAVKAATQGEGVRYGAVTDSEGVVQAHSDPREVGRRLPDGGPTRSWRREGDVAYQLRKDAEGVPLLLLVKPITFQSKLLGRAHLGISLAPVSRQMRQEGILVAVLAVLIAAFGVLLAIRQGGRLLRPVSQWLASSPAGHAQEFHVRIRPEHEFEDLADSFDSISRQLSQKLMVERSFGQYVNPAVLDMIQANGEEPWLKGTRSQVSVLFTDVRGFTAIAGEREPERIVDALNEYFAIATAAIVREGGYVDKYIGDGVLGIFGLPAPCEDHALRAVKASVDMQRDLRRAARNNLNPFLHRIGIGVNSGLVLAGNIGSEDKMEYTVVGDCVNVASRLNGLAEPGEIIIGEEVAQMLPRHLVTLSELEPRQVKGKKEPLRCYKVLRTEF